MAEQVRDKEPTTATRAWALPTGRIRVQLLLLAEIAVIVVWALFVTRPYQTMDANLVPIGREFLSAIQTHHTWTAAATCGACAFWNGAQRGGAPTFVDPYGSMLHPLVVATTLGWGVRNGVKIALIVVFMLGGVAQWWLARVLGLGVVARVWSGMLAVVAGHLGGRAENGNFGLLLSTVACALILPPLIMVARGAGRRTAVGLAVLVALAIVAGQGYMQIALACTGPLFLLLLPSDRTQRSAILGRFAMAGGLALLLAGVFLVPFVHFLPQFGKYIDGEFRAATAFSLMPLHLVINDAAFYYTEALDKLPYPYLYTNFIGWIPVALAAWALFFHKPEQRRLVLVLLLAALVVLWVASGQPLIWIARNIPQLAEQMASVRFHPVMAGLAIPPMLAIAAVGVDQIMNIEQLRLHFALSHDGQQPRGLVFDPRILMILPLLLALLQAYQYNGQWIATTPLLPETQPVLAALRTPDVQWVNPPFGEHPFIEPAVAEGMKLNEGFRTWHWKDRKLPPVVREADRKGVKEGFTQEQMIGDISINVAVPGSEYAVLIAPSTNRSVCSARGLWGDIDVTCSSAEGGVLTIKENVWNGWNARIDNQPATLLPGQWLSLQVPPGDHTITLRYRPWDVVLGMTLSVIGAVLALMVWLGNPFIARIRKP